MKNTGKMDKIARMISQAVAAGERLRVQGGPPMKRGKPGPRKRSGPPRVKGFRRNLAPLEPRVIDRTTVKPPPHRRRHLTRVVDPLKRSPRVRWVRVV